MQMLYTALLALLTPLIVLRLWLKGRVQPAYRQRIGERFGRVPAQPVAVWVHAVSVGESLAALPLIEALIKRHGERRVWVTTTTPTGSERVQAALGTRVIHTYAPYDLPHIVARFLDRARPRQVVVMETELWPNLFAALKARGIPLTIANARLSPRSFKGYSRVAGFARAVLANVTTVAAQSALDAERFSALGAPNVQVCGNLKFDLALPTEPHPLTANIGRLWNDDRATWVAVSTHEGEEAIALDAHHQLLQYDPYALLILVPRHPQRFDEVAERIRARHMVCERRSTLAEHPDFRRQRHPTPVLLGDSMGEMMAYLAAGQLAFVGGSLVPVGGHNVLEPAALGLPVLFGPHMHNFLDARALLLQAGCAREITDANTLAEALLEWLPRERSQDHLEPERQARSERARAAVAANRGALQKLLVLLDAGS
ncbi:MAG: lipid IV(A) 3-deoxy-D-manno-octulosonic acid transferase [Pseudomonadota bacterium]